MGGRVRWDAAAAAAAGFVCCCRLSSSGLVRLGGKRDWMGIAHRRAARRHSCRLSVSCRRCPSSKGIGHLNGDTSTVSPLGRLPGRARGRRARATRTVPLVGATASPALSLSSSVPPTHGHAFGVSMGVSEEKVEDSLVRVFGRVYVFITVLLDQTIQIRITSPYGLHNRVLYTMVTHCAVTSGSTIACANCSDDAN